MKPIKLLVIAPNPKDGTSFYRCFGIMPHLSKNYPVEVIRFDQVNNISDHWMTIDTADIVFIQRPHTSNALHTLRYIKLMGKPVIIDYDDDLFNVPASNPAYMDFKDGRTKEAVTSCIKEADLVLVSTDKLKEVYGSLNNNIQVVRNAFNADLFKYAKDRNIERSNVVLWRGGSGHLHDLEKYKNEILSFVNGKKEYNFAFLGYYPPFIPEERDNIRALNFSDVISYNRVIHNLKPKVIYIPLEDNTFNHCKSNVSYIEGTMAGAVCIAPDFPEFRCPGALLYRDNDEFRELITMALKPDFDVKPHNNKAWKWINGGQSLNAMNDLRWKYIKDLI